MNPSTATKTARYTFSDLADQIENFKDNYSSDVTSKSYFGFPIASLLKAETDLLDPAVKSIAYFSMEYGLAPSIYNSFKLSQPMRSDNQFFRHEVFSNNWLCDYLFKVHIDKMLDIPIYGGGLGVLAGDALKSSADLGYSVAGIGVLWNKGYFKQNFWYKRGQVPEELKWDPHNYPGLVPLKTRVHLDTKDGPLHLRLWKYYVYSHDKKHVCPLVLLDSNLPENSEFFRQLTGQLYRSDNIFWKIYQRAILGIGGMKAIAALGYVPECYHLNEGHAALAFLEKYVTLEDKAQIDDFKGRTVFTCHTPVAAGHDRFMLRDLAKVLPEDYVKAAEMFGKEKPDSDQINLTYMSLNNSVRVNAVAQKHGEVMRLQFPDFAGKVDSITNGVHPHTWLSASFARLFDKYKNVFGDWRSDPSRLAKAVDLRNDEKFRRDIWAAHQENKHQLTGIIDRWGLRDDVFTLGWARRIAGYKRPALLFQDAKRIIKIAYEVGPLQIILAGKAHPNDDIGGAHIDRILDHIDKLNPHKERVRALILENYDTYFGKLLTNSVDVWLNNPLPPFEASGTSGMKAILNGVPQMTTLDGWVVEAENDNLGWIFGYRHEGEDLGSESKLRLEEDSAALYETLEGAVSLYYRTFSKGELNVESEWIDKMINAVYRGAFFNTQRMMEDYRGKMWRI